METTEELKRNEQKSIELGRCLNTAIQQLDNLPLSRELARTKIEEAGMWLGKYQSNVCIELANRLCR